MKFQKSKKLLLGRNVMKKMWKFNTILFEKKFLNKFYLNKSEYVICSQSNFYSVIIKI